jgi:hypothetical protein
LHRSLASRIAVVFTPSIAKSRSSTSHRACRISNISSQSSSSHVLLVDIRLRARTLRQVLAQYLQHCLICYMTWRYLQHCSISTTT